MTDFFLTHLPVVIGVTAGFLVGGLVKGVISIGLPLAALPFLTLVVDIKSAIALLMVPMVLSNVLQAVEGGGTIPLIRRFTPLLIGLVAGTMIGTTLFAVLEIHVLQLTLGPVAILFATASYFHPNVSVPTHSERWLGPVIGFFSGIIGGMTTFFGPLLAAYIVGLKLGRDIFVKSIAIVYVLAASFLMMGGIVHGYATPTLLGISCIGIIPVYLGLYVGRLIRHRTDPDKFHILVLAAVWFTGANLIRLGLGY